MTTTAGFFDAARQYTAQEFARALRAATSPGVVAGIGNSLAVTAGPGLGVTVDTGFAMLLGDWLYTDTTTPLALLAADLTNPRLDRIIVRLTISAKTVEITKLTGTPAPSPVAPTLTQTSDVYEIPLAQVAVAAGAGSITAPNLTDQRQFAGPTVHDIIAGHAAAGLTTGQVLQALSATTFGFAAAPARSLTNAVVNGEFNHWQRGTAFAGIATAAYAADRWQWQQAAAGAVVTIARDTIPPTVGTNAVHTPYNLILTVGTADAAIATGDLYALYHSIEGYEYRALTNGFACSFWVRAHRPGTYCLAFGNRGADRTYVAEYAINVADLWEYKTIVVPAPPTAGTWNYDSGIGLTLYFVLAAGSSWNAGVASTWNSNGMEATANQINGVAATTDVFSLALVNVVPGADARPLAPRPVAEELERCQRYYQVLAAATNDPIATGHASSTVQVQIARVLAAEMGGAPTLLAPAAGQFSVFNAAGTPVACTALSLNISTTRAAWLIATVAGGLVAGNASFLYESGTGTLALAWNPV